MHKVYIISCNNMHYYDKIYYLYIKIYKYFNYYIVSKD